MVNRPDRTELLRDEMLMVERPEVARLAVELSEIVGMELSARGLVDPPDHIIRQVALKNDRARELMATLSELRGGLDVPLHYINYLLYGSNYDGLEKEDEEAGCR